MTPSYLVTLLQWCRCLLFPMGSSCGSVLGNPTPPGGTKSSPSLFTPTVWNEKVTRTGFPCHNGNIGKGPELPFVPSPTSNVVHWKPFKVGWPIATSNDLWSGEMDEEVLHFTWGTPAVSSHNSAPLHWLYSPFGALSFVDLPPPHTQK